MSLFMIATIKQGDNLVGFRMLDLASGRVVDFPYEHVLNILKIHGNIIKNLTVDGNKIKGVNGSLNRYGVVDRTQSCTILSKVLDKDGNTAGYRVADTKGNIKLLREESLISLSKRINISNGKVVKKGGKSFISSIEGEYPIEKSRDCNEFDTVKTGYYIENGIIKDYVTLHPICEHGNIRLDKLISYRYGEVIIAQQLSSGQFTNTKHRIYIYDVKKGAFLTPITVDEEINKCIYLSPTRVLMYGFDSGKFSSSPCGYILLLDLAKFEYRDFYSRLLVDPKIEYIDGDKDVMLMYDAVPDTANNYFKGRVAFTLCKVDFINYSVDPICIIYTDNYDSAKVDWVAFKRPIELIEDLAFCAKIKESLLIYIDGKQSVLDIQEKASLLSDNYTILDGINIGKTTMTIKVSNGEKRAIINAKYNAKGQPVCNITIEKV